MAPGIACAALQISYGVSLDVPPSEGPLSLVLEAPVGVVLKPRSLHFDSRNWETAQTVQVAVMEDFPASPVVRLPFCCYI